MAGDQGGPWCKKPQNRSRLSNPLAAGMNGAGIHGLIFRHLKASTPRGPIALPGHDCTYSQQFRQKFCPGDIFGLSASISVTTPESASRAQCLGDRRLVLFPIVPSPAQEATCFCRTIPCTCPEFTHRRRKRGPTTERKFSVTRQSTSRDAVR
jgi:hypothetical protein